MLRGQKKEDQNEQSIYDMKQVRNKFPLTFRIMMTKGWEGQVPTYGFEIK